jgi:hypothetical protein
MTPTLSIFKQEYIPNTEYSATQASSLVIIDSSIENLEILKSGLKSGAEVVVLHPQLNGIEQITTLVSRRKDLENVHLISHGSRGSLKLGSSELNLDNIADYSAEIQTWFANSGDRVSLFVYGCQVASGEAGKSFVQKLHQLTGADIAAATQTVGSSNRGGVWQLDHTIGTINSEIVFNDEVIEAYSGTFMDEELIAEAPVIEEPVEDAPEDDSTLTNFIGAEIQKQSFVPNRETPATEPLNAIVGDSVEFPSGEIFPSDIPDDNFLVVDENIDITENSIIASTGENQSTGTLASGSFNGPVFTDVSGNLPDIIGVTLDESVTTFDLEPEDITFTADTIELNFESLDIEPGLTAKIDVEFADSATTTSPTADDALIEGEVDEVPIAETPVEGETVEPPVTEEAPVEEVPVEEPVVGEPVLEVPLETPVEGEAPVEETPIEEPVVGEAPLEETPIEEPFVGEPVLEVPLETPVEGEPVADAPEAVNSDVIDLSALAEGDTINAVFSVDREAGYNNTVDFYEVNADGSVLDPDSGVAIAVGEAGYAEAALANRVGLDLAAENGTTAEFSAELEGGKLYAPVIAIDSGFEALLDENPDNDPALYFTYSDANEDGFDHVRNSEPNVFEFEDMPNGGDSDFNDIVVSTAFDGVALPEVPADKPVAEVPIKEPIAEAPVEGAPIKEPVTEAPVEGAPIEEPVTEAPVEGAPIEEPVAEAPVEGAPIEEPIAEAPVEGAPVEGAPIEEPIAEAPVEGAPIEEPVAEAPVEGAPIEEPVAEAPVEETPIEEPVAEAPVEGAPVEGAPIEEPVAEAPVEETPIEEPVAEAPVEGAPVEGAPIEEPVAEAPVEGAPIEEPVAEAPVEGAPVEGAPIEEPVAEAPVEGAPIEEPVAEARVEEAPIKEPVCEAPVEEAPIEEPIAEAPVEEAPIEEPVAEAPIEETLVEEPIAEAPIEEVPIEEPIAEVPIEEPIAEAPVEGTPVVEESPEDSSTISGFEGSEIQLQVFAPTRDEAGGEPLTSTVGDGVEFDNELPPSDIPGDELSVVDVNVDISGGGAGEGSIFFEVDEDQTPGSFVPGEFNGYVFTDISGELPAFENVTLNESATTLGIDSSDISFTEDTIEVNVESLAYEPGLTALLDVEFATV